MQSRRGTTIEIHFVTAGNGSELANVEMGVLDFQGIEGPLHMADAAMKGFAALLLLESRAQATVPVDFADGEHVGVEIGTGLAGTVFYSRPGEDKANQ